MNSRFKLCGCDEAEKTQGVLQSQGKAPLLYGVYSYSWKILYDLDPNLDSLLDKLYVKNLGVFI